MTHAAELVTLNPTPRAPFVIQTAVALRASPRSKRRETWAAAVRELTDPLIRGGMTVAEATEYALAFRQAVEIATVAMDGDDGGGGGTRHPMPERAAA